MTKLDHVTLKNDFDKPRWLDAQASLDATTPAVRAVAQAIVQQAPRFDAPTIARGLHGFVRDRIAYRKDYVNGRRAERLDSSTVILRRGTDDCDGKARLFVALVRAVDTLYPGLGLLARIRPVFEGRTNTHEQAEVRWNGSGSEPLTQANGWLLSELIVDGCELGQSPDDMRKPWKIR